MLSGLRERCHRAGENPSAARGYRMAPTSVVVRVLELRMAGADKVDEENGQTGVEQMEWSNSEMMVK